MTDACGGTILGTYGRSRRNWWNNRAAHMWTDLTGSRAWYAEAHLTKLISKYFHRNRIYLS